MIAEDVLKKAIIKLVSAAAIYLPQDVKDALRKAYEREENPVAKNVIKSILDNVEIAENEKKPMCQDTGVVIFYIEAGEKFPLLGRLPAILREATKEATKRTPLRPNAVDVVTGKNSGDNTGERIPWIEWEIVPDSDEAKITVVLKGGGSEAPSIAKTIPPGLGIKSALKMAVDDIFEMGAKPCPPVIVGIGIAGTADIAMKLAKKALLRPIGSRNPRPKIAEFEDKLLEAINALGWGPHGVGGLTTALDAHIEVAHRHPAALSVGIATSCWANRRSTLKVTNNRIEFVTHPFLGDDV